MYKIHDRKVVFRSHIVKKMLERQQNKPDHHSKVGMFLYPCKKPLCTECIVLSHNGHAFQRLSTAYRNIRDQLQKKKEEIQDKLLPKYRELLEGEFQKRAVLSQQANKKQKQIEEHTHNT